MIILIAELMQDQSMSAGLTEGSEPSFTYEGRSALENIVHTVLFNVLTAFVGKYLENTRL